MVLYFSGTGNSKYVADRIAKVTNNKLISLNDLIKSNKHLEISDDVLLICTPTYAWRIPRIVYDWLILNNFKKNAKVYFVMTCGSDIGNANKYNKALARKLNLKYMGTSEVIMPENYIAMFNSPSLEEEKVILEKAKLKIDEIIKCVINNSPIKSKVGIFGNFMSDIINPYFYKYSVKADKFYVEDSCFSCGLCEKLCPLNNIKLVDGKPAWGKTCTHCMACISYCPKEAIEYGNISKNKRRYYYGKD